MKTMTGLVTRLVLCLLALVAAASVVGIAPQPVAAVASADLAITKTDGVTTATPGGSVTYTITASNAGPSNAPGATVADTFPASLTATWTCVGAGGGTCTASGSGNINDTVNLPAGASVTYTASATISAAATGSLSNTATVSAPGGVTDPTPGNNSATDTDILTPQADLAITKTDGVTTATPGGSVTYTITASNAGPSNAPGATVADTFPASLTATWTCVGAGGGTCTASGSGNINDTVNLPAGASVTYTASATISAAATGSLSNTATVSAPGGVTDPTPGNNSATDTDTIIRAPTTIVSVTRNGATQTNAATVSWNVIFADTVQGVAASNFTTVPSGGLTGTTSISTVVANNNTSADTTWIVTANTGTNSGMLGLNVINDTGMDHQITTTLPFTGPAFTIDRNAPTTTITAQPAAHTNSTSASFTFSATDTDDAPNTLTYQCKLDSGQFIACTSPQQYTNLLAGSHTFTVEASDPLGNTETPGANQTVTWTVDITAPTVAIDSGPTQPSTTSTTATFTFHGSDPGGVSPPVTFQCKLDTGTFVTCTSPTQFTNLSDGGHTFTLQAMDSAGNLATPITYVWTVATLPATVTQVTVASNTSVKVGAGAQLTATATLSNSTTQDVTTTATWTSSDANVANVNASGKVTGESPGTVTITAAINGVSGSAQVTVIAPRPIGIAPNPAPASRPGAAGASTSPPGPIPNPAPIPRSGS